MSAPRSSAGLLRLGIPDFKLEKQVVQSAASTRWPKEGVTFVTNAHVGVNILATDLR